MNHKVLLADDSLTIQKVIKITLANQPYDITDASSEEELFQKLESVRPKIVFLDFNLSEKYTGYELTEKIKSITPSAKILLLLGTFDSVDEAAMKNAGASEKVVKPFDSNKFIAICKQLAESSEEPLPGEIGKVDSNKKAAEKFEEDQWVVNHAVTPINLMKNTDDVASKSAGVNLLNQEISDWGMSIPSVISGEQTNSGLDLPPVINEEKPSLNIEKIEVKDQKLPESSDLDYPTIEEMTQPVDLSHKKQDSMSKLISIDSFNESSFEIEHTRDTYKRDESDVSSIVDQIKDEVEENLWKVDEFEDLKKEVASKIDDVKSGFQPSMNAFDESLFKPLDEEDTKRVEVTTKAVNITATMTDDLRREIELMVKKSVQEYMDQMFQKNVEKISWEVIPDLAENLIRQELVKISSKILSDNH